MTAFSIDHNRAEAIRQEYDLARQHLSEVSSRRNIYNPEHTELYRAVRERLNRATEMFLRG